MLMHVQARDFTTLIRAIATVTSRLMELNDGEIELWRRMPIHNGSSNAGEFVKSAVGLIGI